MTKTTTPHTKTRRATPPRKPKRGEPQGRATGKRSSTRKAKPRVVTEKLVWRGVKLSAAYDPAYFKSTGYASAHLEIRVLVPEGAPVPVTDTGYRSHFLPTGCVERAGGPAAYVRAWLDREAGSPAYRRALDRWRQLSLFDV